MNRSDIMKDCPEEFEPVLKDIIDDIERRIIDIAGLVSISGVADIGNIIEAHEELEKLTADLY